MTAVANDNRVRTMLPFRVHRGRGEAIFLEFDHECDVPLGGRRLMPFQIQTGQPVIDPVLRLMEMFCAMEDSIVPIRKENEQLSSEVDALRLEKGRLEKAVTELKRQNAELRGNGKRGG